MRVVYFGAEPLMSIQHRTTGLSCHGVSLCVVLTAGGLTAATSGPAAAAASSADPSTGGVSSLGPQQRVSDASTAAGLRVLQQELASLAAHDADVRQKRQQLMPLWMELAGLADGWSRDYISRRLY